KDPETGFLYYGARYHWPEVWSGWLSPDPMMDVYPGISPYNYCNWNPLIFVDPDGREVGDYYDKNGKWLYNDGKNDWKIYVEDQKNGVFMGPFQQSHYREVGTVTSVELTYTGNAAVLNNLNICGANGTLSMIQHCDDGNSYVRFSLDAKSGPYSNGSLENGSYTVKQGWQRNENGYRQNGVGFCFPIIPDFETGRTELLIHPDGNNPGTKGCIGITADTFTLKDFYKTTRASIDNYGNLPLTVDIKNNVNNNGKRSTPSILNE
ncbi:MAG: RHS repeat-associated core domain-containing protein, partial [bacterium F082]